MMLIIPIKPMILVLSLLSGVVLLGFIGSSLLDGKKPFITRGEARQRLVKQSSSSASSGHKDPLQVSSALAQ